MTRLFQAGSLADMPEMRSRLRKMIQDNKDIPGALLPILQKAQNMYGYIDADVLSLAAEGLGIPVSQAASVASFYSFFNREQYGTCVIRVCRSAPCHVNGADAVLKALKNCLGIDVGGTTDDGMFSLLECECLGVCDRSPAVMINGTVYGPLTADKIPEFLEKHRPQEVIA